LSPKITKWHRVGHELSLLEPDTRVLVTTAHSPIVAVALLVGKKIAVNGNAAEVKQGTLVGSMVGPAS
jgi:hypothetical protein